MSGTTAKPLTKRITLVLDGANLDRFQVDLSEEIRQTASVTLIAYTVINAPVSGAFPVHPVIQIVFDYGAGIQCTPIHTNIVGRPDLLLALSGATTERYSLQTVVGEMRGSARRSFVVRVFDEAGVEHNHSTHRLFDWLTVELEALEVGMLRGPLALQGVPTIQQSFDTI